MIVVTNYDLPAGPRSIYIGRGTPLGNPFTHVPRFAEGREWMTVVPTREMSVECFDDYIREAIQAKAPTICRMLNHIWRLARTGDVQLICHCKPLACHGDVIKKIIEERL